MDPEETQPHTPMSPENSQIPPTANSADRATRREPPPHMRLEQDLESKFAGLSPDIQPYVDAIVQARDNNQLGARVWIESMVDVYRLMQNAVNRTRSADDYEFAGNLILRASEERVKYLQQTQQVLPDYEREAMLEWGQIARDYLDRARSQNIPAPQNIAPPSERGRNDGNMWSFSNERPPTVHVEGSLTPSKAWEKFTETEENGGFLIESDFATGQLKEDDYEKHQVVKTGDLLAEGLSDNEKSLLRLRLLLSNARARKDQMFTPDQADALPERYLLSFHDLDRLFRHSFVSEAVSIYTVLLTTPNLAPRNFPRLSETITVAGMQRYRESLRNLLSRNFRISYDEAKKSELIAYNFIQLVDLADDLAADGRELGGFVNPAYKSIMNPRASILSIAGKQEYWPQNLFGTWIHTNSKRLLSEPEQLPISERLFYSFLRDVSVIDQQRTGTNQNVAFLGYLYASGLGVLQNLGVRAFTPPWHLTKKDFIFLDYQNRRVRSAMTIIKALSKGEVDDYTELENAFQRLGTVDSQTRKTLATLTIMKKEGFFNPRKHKFELSGNPLTIKGLWDGFRSSHPNFFN